MNTALPECIGYFGEPIQPNNCKTCRERELCRRIADRFIPKHEVLKFINQLQAVVKE